MVTVKIENTYADGHESQTEARIPGPAPSESLEDWFEEKVYPYYGIAPRGVTGRRSRYTATIVATDTAAHLGCWHEWIDQRKRPRASGWLNEEGENEQNDRPSGRVPGPVTASTIRARSPDDAREPNDTEGSQSTTTGAIMMAATKGHSERRRRRK
jgi:hypothetical protein